MSTNNNTNKNNDSVDNSKAVALPQPEQQPSTRTAIGKTYSFFYKINSREEVKLKVTFKEGANNNGMIESSSMNPPSFTCLCPPDDSLTISDFRCALIESKVINALHGADPHCFVVTTEKEIPGFTKSDRTIYGKRDLLDKNEESNNKNFFEALEKNKENNFVINISEQLLSQLQQRQEEEKRSQSGIPQAWRNALPSDQERLISELSALLETRTSQNLVATIVPQIFDIWKQISSNGKLLAEYIFSSKCNTYTYNIHNITSHLFALILYYISYLYYC